MKNSKLLFISFLLSLTSLNLFAEIPTGWSWCVEGLQAALMDLALTQRCYNNAQTAFNQRRIDSTLFTDIHMRLLDAQGFLEDGKSRCLQNRASELAYVGDRFTWVKRACQAACGVMINPTGSCYYNDRFPRTIYKNIIEVNTNDEDYKKKILDNRKPVLVGVGYLKDGPNSLSAKYKKELLAFKNFIGDRLDVAYIDLSSKKGEDFIDRHSNIDVGFGDFPAIFLFRKGRVVAYSNFTVISHEQLFNFVLSELEE